MIEPEMVATADGDYNRGAIFQPQEAVGSAMGLMGKRLEEKEAGLSSGITLNLPELRDYIRPVYPGELWVVCALSRNGKSFFMKKVLFDQTMSIYQKGPSDECTVIMTWEESAETLAMNWLAKMSGISSTKMLRGGITREEFDNLKTVAVKVKQYPIYIIGPSINRGSDGIRRKPDLGMKGVEKALDWIMNKQGKNPQLIVGDYAQRVPVTGSVNKRELHIMAVIDWFKDLGFWAGAPVMMGSQAKQVVEDRQYPQPRLYDSEWSANAGQSADVFTGLWMPKTTYLPPAKIDKFMDYKNFQVSHTLMFLGVNKQKGDFDGFVFPLETMPDRLAWRMADFYYDSNLARDMKHVKPREPMYR